MALSMPKHTEWVAFKKTMGIPAGAVKGLDVGKSLDKYNNGLSHDFKKNAELAKEIEAVFAKYLKGLPESKVAKGKYAGFKSEFTSDYLLTANRLAEEFDAMGGDLEAFGGRVGLLLREAGKLKAGATLAQLQSFRSGPVRGMMAAATKVKKYDPAKLVQHWTPVDDVINKLDVSVQQPVLDKCVQLIAGIVGQSREIATKDGLQL